MFSFRLEKYNIIIAYQYYNDKTKVSYYSGE